MTYAWDMSLETGIESVDAQHRRLFELASDLDLAIEGLACGDDPVGDAVYALTEYCVEHFADEEALMEGSGYPDLEPHREAHRILTARTMKITTRYFNGEEIAPTELAPFVVDWLKNHIEREDKAFAAHFKRVPDES